MSQNPQDDFNTEQPDAIFSSILAECPELWDVVERFARELPSKIDELEQTARNGGAEALHAHLTQLIEQGQKFGYPALSHEAARIEAAGADQMLDDLEYKLREMRLLADQIRAGITQEPAE